MTQMHRCRLAVLASHPIQYFTPVYRRLAARPQIDLEVMYYRDFGVQERFDKQFGQKIRWDTDQLTGYRHRFLTNVSPVTDTFNPMHAFNPGAFARLLLGKYDALWLNGYAYPSNWLALAASSLRRMPLLFRSDLRLPDSTDTRRYRHVRDAVIRWWMRRSDALLYIGKANREAYLHYGATESKLFFSPFSVDVELIDSMRVRYAGSERHALRQRWGLPTNVPVILSVGKLVAQKRPDALLKIAHALGDSAHVVFAGSGPLEFELKERAAAAGLRNVSFLGFVNQSKLPEVYACADVFVMASVAETWGLVVNEAMAAGAVPVVTNEVGSHHDLVTEGVTGYVVLAGDVDSMISRVQTLVLDEKLRARLSDAARKRIAAYSYDATTDGVVTALRAVGALRAAGLNTGAQLPAVADSPESVN